MLWGLRSRINAARVRIFAQVALCKMASDLELTLAIHQLHLAALSHHAALHNTRHEISDTFFEVLGY